MLDSELNWHGKRTTLGQRVLIKPFFIKQTSVFLLTQLICAYCDNYWLGWNMFPLLVSVLYLYPSVPAVCCSFSSTQHSSLTTLALASMSVTGFVYILLSPEYVILTWKAAGYKFLVLIYPLHVFKNKTKPLQYLRIVNLTHQTTAWRTEALWKILLCMLYVWKVT